MAVQVVFDAKLLATETITTQDVVNTPELIHQIGAGSERKDADTTPAVSVAFSDTGRALTAGAETIDLTSLSRATPLSTIDLTGLKIQYLKIVAKSTNTNALVVTKGGSNPYLLGDTNSSFSIPAGGVLLLKFNAGLAVVSSTVKNLALSSSMLTANYDIEIIAG